MPVTFSAQIFFRTVCAANTPGAAVKPCDW